MVGCNTFEDASGAGRASRNTDSDIVHISRRSATGSWSYDQRRFYRGREYGRAWRATPVRPPCRTAFDLNASAVEQVVNAYAKRAETVNAAVAVCEGGSCDGGQGRLCISRRAGIG